MEAGMQRPLLHLKSSGEHVVLAEHHQTNLQIQSALSTQTHTHTRTRTHTHTDVHTG